LADFAKRPVIDRHKDDVPAGLVNMCAVAKGAERVFANFSEADQAEDERGHCCPDQQFPAGLLTLLRPRKRTEKESFSLRGPGVPHKGYQIGNRDSVNEPNDARRLPLSYDAKIVHGRARMTCYRRATYFFAAGPMAESPSSIVHVSANFVNFELLERG
jgi:hypothetical protein